MYVEDAFEDFYHLIVCRQIIPEKQDKGPITSFGNIIISNRQFTEKQGSFALKLLHKYQKISELHGLDYEDIIVSPSWKNSFRVIDYTRKVWVEQDEEQCVWICVKFPYKLRQEFDKNVTVGMDELDSDVYDKDRALRMLSANKTNFLALDEFVKTNNFECDRSYDDLISFVNEAMLNNEKIIPLAYISESGVQLKNVTESVEDYFQLHKSHKDLKDILLVKSMGIPFMSTMSTPVHKIASSETSFFWTHNLKTYLSIINETDATSVFIKDRNVSAVDWTVKFLAAADEIGIEREDIVICFRDDDNFNDYIKQQRVTGKISDQKIFVFDHKPAKWLFKKKKDVTIIGTDVLFMNHLPPVARSWVEAHHCVINVNESKPVLTYIFEEKNIVEL